MKYFNVPADYKIESIDKYDEINRKYPDAKIVETYGQISIGNCIGSGRSGGLIPRVDMNGLRNYVAYSREKAIGFNYTLNTTCMENREFTKEGLLEIIEFLEELYDIGVRSLTIALPSLMELVRIRKMDFEIKASTLCHITNANKALAFKRMGVDKLVVDESISRDFNALKRIRNCFGSNVEIITNVICHKNCVYRVFHYNYTSHDLGYGEADANEAYGSYYSHRCMMQRCASASNIMKLGWIRPEDIKHYTGIGINNFKIQGRQAVMDGDPFKTVEAYMQESYDGNLMELLDMFSPTNSFKIYIDNKKLDGFIEPFVNNREFCRNDCLQCNYCENFARKHLDYRHIEEIFSTAANFYKEYDMYVNMAKSLRSSGKSKKKTSIMEQLLFNENI